MCVNLPPTPVHRLTLLRPFVATALVNFPKNTHDYHCRRHKQLSVGSNPPFRINMSSSCSSERCAAGFTPNNVRLGRRGAWLSMRGFRIVWSTGFNALVFPIVLRPAHLQRRLHKLQVRRDIFFKKCCLLSAGVHGKKTNNA